MKKIILVTGGAGFIGKNLIEKLLKKTSYSILSYDNYSTGSVKNHIYNKRVKYIKGDTININKKLFNYKKKIICIFHFGEFARIHQSFYLTDQCFSSNVNGTYEVFKFGTLNKIRIIYSATSASIGNNGKDCNLSPYAFTKAKNISLLNNYKKWFGLKFDVIYFYNVYGPNQIKDGFMATVIGIFEHQYLNKRLLTVVRPGTQKRKFTHIDDTVEACLLVLKRNKNTHYSISYKKSYSINEIAKFFERKIKYLPKRRGERYSSSIKNIINNKKVINLKAKIDIKDYISDFLKQVDQ